jgi:hypothetical protein
MESLSAVTDLFCWVEISFSFDSKIRPPGNYSEPFLLRKRASVAQGLWANAGKASRTNAASLKNTDNSFMIFWLRKDNSKLRLRILNFL